MKVISSLALLPLVSDAARNVGIGSRGFPVPRSALVIAGTKEGGGFNYATGDGGADSASFYGEPPKGGKLFKGAAKEVANAARDTVDAARDTASDLGNKLKKETGSINVNDIDNPLDDKSFWEGRLFREGGLGFLFGVGTAACLKKGNKPAAIAVGSACVAAQYVSRSDCLGLGGKLGWPKLNMWQLRECQHGKMKSVHRVGRIFKHTIAKSVPTVEGYVLGVAVGLKTPMFK